MIIPWCKRYYQWTLGSAGRYDGAVPTCQRFGYNVEPFQNAEGRPLGESGELEIDTTGKPEPTPSADEESGLLGEPGSDTPEEAPSGTPGNGESGSPDGPGGSAPEGGAFGTLGGGESASPDGPGGGLPENRETDILGQESLKNGDGTPDTPPELTEIDDDATPLARFTNRFQPRGISYGGRACALVNLLALFCTAYLLLPLLHLRTKYCRAGTMKKMNRMKAELRTASNLEEEELAERLRIHRKATEEKAQNEGRDVETAVREAEAENFAEITQDDFSRAVETLYYHVKKYVRRFRLGIALELALVTVAAYVFIHTENIYLPMVLIDKWTPLMLLFLILCWVTDICLAQYRDKLSFPMQEADSVADSDGGISNVAG